jgi:nitrogen regulatory protein PII
MIPFVRDGKIITYKVDQVVRIRTGERGDTALK